MTEGPWDAVRAPGGLQREGLPGGLALADRIEITWKAAPAVAG